jgi:hypothetical protein
VSAHAAETGRKMEHDICAMEHLSTGHPHKALSSASEINDIATQTPTPLGVKRWALAEIG